MTAMPEIGARVADRYTLVKEIGHGGMARVYRAVDAELDRPVAIKLLREPLVEYAERFEREARTMGRLQHPSVVKVYGYGVSDEGLPYLVLEFIDDAVGLHSVIAERGRMSAVEAASLMLPVVGALAEAHRHGIVHRDIKPDNILLQRAAGLPPQLRLIDFGIAAWDEPTAQRLTQTGQVFGTPTHMAPEHASGKFGANAQADVWALGVVLYEMVSGESPFRGPHVTATLFNIINKHPPPLEGASSEFQALVDDCLAKEREDRPADAGVVLERLQGIVRQSLGPAMLGGVSALGGAMTVEMTPGDGVLPAPALETPPPTAALVHRPPPGREQRARWVIALASAIGGLVLGLIVGLSRSDAPTEGSAAGPRATAAAPGAAARGAAAVPTGAADDEPPPTPPEAAPPEATPAKPAPTPTAGLTDPALAALDAFIEAGEGQRTLDWLAANPEAGAADARARAEGLGLLAADRTADGLTVLDELMTRRPDLARDALTQRMLLDVVGEKKAKPAVSLLTLMARADATVMDAVMNLTDDDHYRTRVRAVGIIEKAGGDVDRADFRFYVRNLRVRDCDVRRVAVENLVELRDPAAVGPIKRMQSLYGWFESRCMGDVDDDAIKRLSRMPPKPKADAKP